jgi:hypothetical protein
MRIITLLLLTFGLLGTAVTATAADGDSIRVQAILVSASKQPGKTDKALSRYESTLRRILRFETFKQLGSDRDSASVPGAGTLSIGSGHQIQFRTEASGDDRLRVQIIWQGGDRTLMRTGLALRPGVPAVLGGPARNDDEVYAVIIIAD